MNYNGNQENLNHLIAISQNPQLAQDLQLAVNKKRLARIEKSFATMPVFIPMTFALDAAGKLSAYSQTTETVNDDILITGIISDNGTRQFSLRRSENQEQFLYVGEAENLFLTLDEISGQSVEAKKSQEGIFYFTTPFTLYSNQRLKFDIWKTNAVPNTVELINVCLVGLRLANRKSTLGGLERERVLRGISARPVPEVRFLKQTFNFDSAIAGGRALEIRTPQADEPLLIRGVRTNFANSTIDIRLENGASWSPKAFPIWALGAETDSTNDAFRYFERPIFLPQQSQLEMTIKNGIYGDNDPLIYVPAIDGQNGNTITWLCESV